MRILLDSNIWRYIIDANALPVVQRAARRSRHKIAVAPAVLYEAAHTRDKSLRDALLSAMCLPIWKRLMPEAYSEAAEIRDEVRRVRSEWLRPVPDLTKFKRVRHDWTRTRGGVWNRIRHEAELLQNHDAEMKARARKQAYTLREDSQSWSPKWRAVPLGKTLIGFPSPVDGWNGEPVEAWRFDGFNVFQFAMATRGHPFIDWLEGELKLDLMLFQQPALMTFWLHEVEAPRMPRHWLRWGFEFLQRFHRVTEGTPVDTQLGTYLLDVDLMVSADKNLVHIAERCRAESPFPIAESRPVQGGSGAIDAICELLEAN